MAAPVIPNDMGGNRVQMLDPENVGISTTVGDLTAINLKMMHLMRDVIDAGPGRDAFQALANETRAVLAASEAARRREQATRVLTPITRIPPEWGVIVNIGPIRMNNIPTFTGTTSDTIDVVRWISRIFIAAGANLLTYNACINLMIQGSAGGAADYIEQMQSEGKTLEEIVQQLEMRYGDLCTPEEARVKTNNMVRKENESLSNFIDRLRSMARMACRMEANDAARLGIDALVEGNIRRVLPTSVRRDLEERVINRSRIGLPSFTAREIEKECLDLERRREERKVQLQEMGAGKRNAKIQNLNQATESSSDDNDSSADEVDLGDEATHHLIREIKQQQRRFAEKGRPYDHQKVFKKAFRNFNNRRPPYGARQAANEGAPVVLNAGPPEKLDKSIHRTITELLQMAKVTKGSCIQCGQEGHYMHNDKCALKGKTLMDRACVKCGTGLHSADDCLKMFQKQYVAGNQAAADLKET
jgi:hypothetical protein